MAQSAEGQAQSLAGSVPAASQDPPEVKFETPPVRQVTGLPPLDPKFRYSRTKVLKRNGSYDPEFFRSRNINLDESFSESFFESFTSYHLRADNLPVIVDGYDSDEESAGSDEDDNLRTKMTPLPLFDGLGDNDEQVGSLTEKSLEGPSGQVLAFRKLVEMNKSFALAEMREELWAIRTAGTTSREQMARIRKMLVDFAILKDPSIKMALEHEEQRLMELRCEEHVRLYPPIRRNTDLSVAEQAVVEAQEAEKEKKHIDFGKQLLALGQPGGFAKWAGIRTVSLDTYLNRVVRKRTLRRADFPKRFVVCIGGGVALVVPMVIMVFDSSLTKSLVTVSVATVLIAALIAWNSNGEPHELLDATAAYAAALVIFVGFNSP